MNLVVLVGFILINSNAEGFTYKDFSPFYDEDVFERFSPENSNDNKNVSAEIRAVTNLKENQLPMNFPLSGKEDFPGKKSEEDPNEILESMLIDLDRNSEILPALTQMSPEILLLNRLSEIHRRNDEVSAENYMNEKKKSWPVPSRRGIDDSWPSPVDLGDTENFPWNFDAYYPQENKFIGNEYNDYPSLPTYLPQNKNASLLDGNSEKNSVWRPREKLGTNHHRNDHNVNRGSYHGNPRTQGFEEQSKKRRNNQNSRKYLSQNSCRQYLEFLKYAFEKLDESPDHRYEYVDDYAESNGEKPGRERGFASSGQPLFFRPHERPSNGNGNPKKVSHVNIKDSFVQNVESGSTISITIPFHSSTVPTNSNFLASSSSTSTITTPSPTTNGLLRGGEERGTGVPPWSGSSSTISEVTIGQTVKEFATEIVSTTPAQTESPKFLERSGHGPGGSYSKTTQGFTSTLHTEFKNITQTTAPGSVKTGVPQWLFPDSQHKNLGIGMKGKTLTTTTLPGSRRSGTFSDPRMTTYSPTMKEDDLRVTIQQSGMEESIGTAKNDIKDCNDKMLPCPDTFNITYPLNGYCNRYVSCESGRAVRRTCPEGLHFNVITKSCDLPHNSFCNYVCPTTNGYFGIPGDCSGYFVCKNSFAEYRMCPPKMHWDEAKEICTFSGSSNCPMKCTNANEVKKYEGDCKAYVICLNWVPYYHKCPPNTKFDGTALTCISDHLSTCEDNPRLMTKILNLNVLCGDMNKRMGSEVWCSFYKSKEEKEDVFEH